VTTIHASAVLVGARAVLIRGAAGSGKSSLAFALIRAGQTGAIRFTRLVGDDRVRLEATHGCLLLRPAEALTGLIEVRGLGVRRVPFELVAAVGLVVDLGAADAERLPTADSAVVEVLGVTLPRLAVAPAADPVSLLFAALRTVESDR
jgi:HPr kinase/phosphorylase